MTRTGQVAISVSSLPGRLSTQAWLETTTKDVSATSGVTEPVTALRVIMTHPTRVLSNQTQSPSKNKKNKRRLKRKRSKKRSKKRLKKRLKRKSRPRSTSTLSGRPGLPFSRSEITPITLRLAIRAPSTKSTVNLTSSKSNLLSFTRLLSITAFSD